MGLGNRGFGVGKGGSGGGTGSTYTNPDGSVIEVGGIPAGTTFNATTFATFVDMLLYPELFGVLTAPSATFTSAVTGFREVGEIIASIAFNSSFNRGSINPQYLSTSPYRSGLPNQYILTGTGLVSISKTDLTDLQTISNYTVLLGLQSWTGRVAYDAGVQPKGSKGTDFDTPLSAGNTSIITRSITGVYPFYSTTVSIATMTKQALAAMGSVIVTNLVAESGSDKQSFEIPVAWGSLSVLEQYNTLSNQYDAIDVSSFTVSSIVKNINGTNINYNKYTHNGLFIGARTLRLTF